ncbi:MAG: GntR family transcriptional regulator [Candidatus Hadarchaeum sp.]
MVIKPERTTSDVEINRIVKTLRREIFAGYRLPRERLIEGDLVKEYGVNRMVVRQAIRQLQAEGLVNIEPFRGAWVSEVSLDQILEQYHVLAILEGAAAEMAATRISGTDVNVLEANIAMQKVLDPGNVKRWQELNHEFHKTINLRSGNSKLIQLIKEVSRFTSYWFIMLSIPGRIEANIKEHEEIVKSLKSRDGRKARVDVENHVLGAGRYLVNYLTEIPLVHAKKGTPVAKER